MFQEVSEFSSSCQLQAVPPAVLAKFFPAIERLGILRLDLPDPISGGNKSYKLKYNFEWLKQQGRTAVLTFGGAYSNHIAATACAGKKYGVEMVGIIRGEELDGNSNAVLRFALTCGMKLHFVAREEYRRRNDPDYLKELSARFGISYILPEGGSNALAVKGCMEILTDKCDEYSEIVCPVGTGATVAGIIASAKRNQHVRALAIVESRDYLLKNIEAYLREYSVRGSWELDGQHTLGGYASENIELRNFIGSMKNEMDLPLDFVYSGKTLFAIHNLARAGYFEGRKVLFIHTGGYGFLGK